MIQRLARHEIDTNRWKECILSSSNGMVNVLPWYLDIVAPGWNALVYNNYEAVMVLPQKSKWGIPFLYNPNFIRQIGIFSSQVCDEKIMQLFFDAIREKSLYSSFFISQKVEKLPCYERVFQYCSLSDGFLFNENTKRNIKKAEKKQLVALDNLNAKEVFTMYNENRGKFLHHSSQDLEVLLQLMEKGLLNQQGKAFGAVDSDGNLQTAAYFFFFQKTIYYLIGSATSEGKKNGAMHWLFAQIMEKYKNQYEIFDFGGSNIDSVATFYKGLGGKNQTYYHYEQGLLKPLVKLLKRA